jgi:large subunit ribosomal protein L22
VYGYEARIVKRLTVTVRITKDDKQNMQYMTIQKNITMTPRKVRYVADMVRKMTPYRALDVLQFTNRAAAVPVAKAIKTVVANAGKAENLSFVSIEVNEGLKMKRYRAGTAGRGRGRPYRRRMSHIKIVITDEVQSEVGKVSKAEQIKVEEPKVIEATEVKAEKVEKKGAKKS